jgi:hypothetical protein
MKKSVWLPHQIFLGSESDVLDLANAITKVVGNIGELVGYDDERIRTQGMSACPSGPARSHTSLLINVNRGQS